jgi:hypothetical protein
METRASGYLALLRRNRPFRRLWYGQVASLLGDWLDTIALYILLLRWQGSLSPRTCPRCWWGRGRAC